MPPKNSTNADVPDVKTRRLTDFWVKKDGGSSPVAPTTSQPLSQVSTSSSPLRNATAKAAGPTPFHSSKTLAFTVGPFNVDAPRLTPNKTGRSSPMKPEVSPRKFIVISDDEEVMEVEKILSKKRTGETVPDSASGSSMKPGMSPERPIVISEGDSDEVMEVEKLLSKKRPRENGPDSATGTMAGGSARYRTPEKSNSNSLDLFRSPPKKRRATDALVSQGGGGSQLVSASLSKRNGFAPTHKIMPSDSSNASFLSAESGDIELSFETQSQGPKTASEPPTTSAPTPSSSPSISPPTNETTNAASEPPQETTAEAKARSRIEEIKRKAMMQTEAKPTVIVMDWDISDDEDEDILEKAFGTKKRTPPPPQKPTRTPSRTAPYPTASDLFSSPLSDLPEDRPPPKKPVKRATPAPAPMKKTRASSKAPDLPAPKPPTKPLPKKRAATPAITTVLAPAGPKFTMPSSLADILGDKPKTKKGASEEKVARFLQEVEEDMKEITRRRLYGDSDEGEPHTGDTMVIDQSVTEMALGEKDARKINEVFESDRRIVHNTSPWRPFWNEQLVGAMDVTMQTEYRIPPISLADSIHPMMSVLKQIIADNDCLRLSTFLGCGMQSSIPLDVISTNLSPWLFALACSSHTPPELALLAELSLSNAFSMLSGSGVEDCPVTIPHIISAILSLGPLSEALACIISSPTTVSPPRDPITRDTAVTSLVRIVRSAIKANLSLPEPESLALLLLLLYLDPSTSTQLRRAISLIFEDILISIACDKDNAKEMDVCKRVVAATTNFRLVEKRSLLDCVFGGQSDSRRFMRWLAVGLIFPETVGRLDWATYLKPPSLSQFAEMLDLSRNPTSPYRIWSKTNYEDLLHNVEILGTLLTDVRIYSPSQDASVDRILLGLDTVHGRISDARAAFLDRTRAKDALQRLKLRVHFQYKHTGQATIDKMLKPE